MDDYENPRVRKMRWGSSEERVTEVTMRCEHCGDETGCCKRHDGVGLSSCGWTPIAISYWITLDGMKGGGGIEDWESLPPYKKQRVTTSIREAAEGNARLIEGLLDQRRHAMNAIVVAELVAGSRK